MNRFETNHYMKEFSVIGFKNMQGRQVFHKWSL